MTRIWFDTEFQELDEGIRLISLGAIREDNAEFYAEADWFHPDDSNPWVVENVHPHLVGGEAVKTRTEIANRFAKFTLYATEFWADSPAYDWVVTCQLYGQMIDRPRWWPFQARDLRHLSEQVGVATEDWPKPRGRSHDALADARHHRAIWEHLNSKLEP